MSSQHLHELRLFELRFALRTVRCLPGAAIVELGAGTGFQARELVAMGFKVRAFDVDSSAYREGRIFPVEDYDGSRLPLADRSADVVFSSNVLEHVSDLPSMLAEIHRVLKDDGIAIHILPTSAWRFWSLTTHYVWAAKRLLSATPPEDSMLHRPSEPKKSRLKKIFANLFPRRHGERGSALSELWIFSRRIWVRTFSDNGYGIVTTQGVPLFYTGGFAVGPALSLDVRTRLSRVLGSACRVYVLKKEGSV